MTFRIEDAEEMYYQAVLAKLSAMTPTEIRSRVHTLLSRSADRKAYEAAAADLSADDLLVMSARTITRVDFDPKPFQAYEAAQQEGTMAAKTYVEVEPPIRRRVLPPEPTTYSIITPKRKR